MNKVFIILFMAISAIAEVKAQVKIGNNPANISPGSLLELESTSKALTLPRMTTVQMQAIPSPINGMIIFNTDSNCIYLYKANNVWGGINLNASAAPAISWPYRSNDNVTGAAGNAEGIVAVTGTGLVASGDYSHAEGINSVASGMYSWSSGFGDTASGLATTAMGYQNKASNLYGVAFGYKNISAYQSSVAMGQENADSGWASLTMGIRNKIFNLTSYSNALGYENQVRSGSSNTALGEGNIIKAGRAITNVGYANIVDAGNFSTVAGTGNDVLAGNSHIAGGENNTIKSGNANSIFGQNNFAEGSYLGAIGRDNIVYYQSAIALGQANKDSGYASVAAGLSNTIKNNVQYSMALGYINQVNAGSSNAALGEGNIINSGRGNSIMGFANSSNTNFSSLFGTSNEALAGNSHTAGGENNTIKSGNANSIFGLNNIAEGSYLGAIGKENYVYYQSAVALGQGNRDSGYASVTGGLSNVIEKNVQYSASFGQNNLSSRNMSLYGTVPGAGTFSAGLNNFNSGFGSIALGSINRSSNVFTLAANHGTLANSNSMSAFGHFNDTIAAFQGEGFDAGEMLFSIGNGLNNENRRNSFTMLRNGFTTINATTEAGANVPRAELDIKGTGAIIVPVGTTEQRPATPVQGMIRFCTDCTGGPVLQGFDGTNWVNL